MKARVFAILLAILTLLTIGGALAWFFWFRVVKLDFNELGGTVLVYEIDLRENQQGPDRMFDPDRDMDVLAQAIERRLDPDGRGYAYVRAVGNNRVEIRIPRRQDHADEILAIKDLISRAGILEFRMLANGSDDANGIEQARKMLADQADGELRKALMDCGEQGLPPPGPRVAGTREPLAFQIALAAGAKSFVSYSWVELGPQERRALNLDNAAREDPARDTTWKAAAAARNRATYLPELGAGDRRLLSGALFYSRPCVDRNLPDEIRRSKQFDYFVLARDPEFEGADHKRRTARIDGSYLSNAHAVKGQDGRPTVAFTFNAAGGELFANLTRKNISEGRDGPAPKIRHLAIILDGMIMSAPSINSEIRTQGQISGNFTQKEVDSLTSILRSGAMPARLKSMPMSESEVPPAEKK